MSQRQQTKASASRSAEKGSRKAAARRLSPAQLRARTRARIRALAELTAELRRQCEETAAECAELQQELSRSETSSAPGGENRLPNCADCSVRRELLRARAAQARLRTDFVELLAFLEEISALLIPEAEVVRPAALSQETAGQS